MSGTFTAAILTWHCTSHPREQLENPAKTTHQEEENLMVKFLQWGSKALDSEASSLAFPCKKGQGKAKQTELPTCVFPPSWSYSFGKQIAHSGPLLPQHVLIM